MTDWKACQEQSLKILRAVVQPYRADGLSQCLGGIRRAGQRLQGGRFLVSGEVDTEAFQPQWSVIIHSDSLTVFGRLLDDAGGEARFREVEACPLRRVAARQDQG